MVSTDILQFGEGNFLRAFVDYCIQNLNEKTSFSGKVNVIQPLPSGKIEQLKKQKGKYHLYQEGVMAGKVIQEKLQINCIDQMVNPYQEFDNYLKLAENENLNFVFSNTTEAGIALEPSDIFEARPPKSFPGKLTRLLYHRFQKFDGDPLKVLHIIPCELINNNGNKLREIILELCDTWELREDF